MWSRVHDGLSAEAVTNAVTIAFDLRLCLAGFEPGTLEILFWGVTHFTTLHTHMLASRSKRISAAAYGAHSLCLKTNICVLKTQHLDTPSMAVDVLHVLV